MTQPSAIKDFEIPNYQTDFYLSSGNRKFNSEYDKWDQSYLNANEVQLFEKDIRITYPPKTLAFSAVRELRRKLHVKYSS